MTKQLFLSGIAGFVVYFLLGWLAYGILFTEETTGEESMLFIALGCLFYAFVYATIFTRWANISTFSTGLKAGDTWPFIRAELEVLYDYMGHRRSPFFKESYHQCSHDCTNGWSSSLREWKNFLVPYSLNKKGS